MVTKSFADLAVESGHTTEAWVNHARTLQRSFALRGQRVFLAEILVSGRAITQDQALDLFERGKGYRESAAQERAAPPFGDVVVRKGYVSPAELFGALQRQRDEDAMDCAHRLLGDILVDSRQLSRSELADVLGSMAASTRAPTPDAELSGGGELWARRSYRSPRDPVVALPSSSRHPWTLVVSQVMSRVVVTASHISLGEVLDQLAEAEVSVALVVEGKRLSGMIDLWDVQEIARTIPVSRLMRDFQPAVTVRTSVVEVARLLTDSGRVSLAVIAGLNAVGAITRDDLRRVGVTAADLEEASPAYDELGVVD